MLRRVLVVLVLGCAALYFLFADEVASGGLQLFDPAGEARVIDASDMAREVEVPAGALSTESMETSAPSSVTVRGHVLSADKTPIAGATVVLQHPYLRSTPASSDATGQFALDVEEAHGELALDSEGWLLLGGERFLSVRKLDGYTLIAAPARVVRGRVVDHRGAPVRGAEVRSRTANDALVPLGIVSLPMVAERQTARSDADGRFELAAPVHPTTRVEASLGGYRTSELRLIDLPLDKDVALVLTAH